jgi:menaquinone-9 beta-reductase
VTGCDGRTDVFVVGGGPAGLAAALAARRKGFAVTVADGCEPPIDKACGEGLMPETLAALRALNVQLPAGAGCRFRGIRFVQQDAAVEAEFPEGPGVGIHRARLHQALINAAEKCGVTLLWNTPVLGIEKNQVHLNGETVKARWMIGADGCRSRVRRWSGLEPGARVSSRLASRRHYRLRPWTEFAEAHWGPRVQAYVTPVAADEICVVTMAETAEEAHFDRALTVLPELRKRLADAEIDGRERGAITALQSLRRVWRGQVALVGDASGGVDAITGEGLRLAFRQAEALADAMKANDLRAYQRRHRQLTRRPMWMSRLLLMLGRQEIVRARTMQTLSRRPELFARLLAVHTGTATARDAVLAGTQMAWQYLAS